MPDTQPNRTIHIRSISANDRSRILRNSHRRRQFQRQEIDTAMELVDEALQKGEESGYIIVVLKRRNVLAIAGYACYGPTPLTEGVFDLYWIAVHPEAQGRGIGRESDPICGKGHSLPWRTNAPDRDFVPRRISVPRLVL